MHAFFLGRGGGEGFSPLQMAESREGARGIQTGLALPLAIVACWRSAAKGDAGSYTAGLQIAREGGTGTPPPEMLFSLNLCKTGRFRAPLWSPHF